MLVYHRDRMLEAAQHFDFHAVSNKLEDGKALHEALLQQVKEYVEKGGQDEALKVIQFLKSDIVPGLTILQLRILFDKEANMTVDFSPVPPVSLSTLYPSSFDPPNQTPPPHPAKEFKPSPLTGGALTLGAGDSLLVQPSTPECLFRLDTQPTPSTPFTLLKTTYRDFYDQARKRALPVNSKGPEYAEVLLYNEVSELTEGTMTSLYVLRGGRWVTPPVGVPAGEFTSTTLKEGGGNTNGDEGELRKPFAGRWGHSVRSAKVGAGGQRGTSRRWALKKGFCMEEPVSIDTVAAGERVWVSSGVRGFRFGRVVQ